MSATPMNGGTSRAVNEKIRELAQAFTDAVGDDGPSEYFCECGCGRQVPLSPQEFDGQCPVLVPGHEPPHPPEV